MIHQRLRISIKYLKLIYLILYIYFHVTLLKTYDKKFVILILIKLITQNFKPDRFYYEFINSKNKWIFSINE
jgi:hypothetical protein